MRAAPRLARRLLCTPPAFATSADLEGTRSVLLPLRTSSTTALRPSASGTQRAHLVGAGDRGGGLEYRAGRLPSAEAMDEILGGTDGAALSDDLFVVKVQAPLDNSSDARGGMGMMTPATLLVHSRDNDLVQLVEERDFGHTDLLRCALRQKGQVGYCYAAVGDRVALEDGPGLRVYTEVLPPPDATGW